MAIRVIFSAQARVAAGRDEASLECAGSMSLLRVLDLIAKTHGDSLRQLIMDERGAPHAAVMFFVNDEQICGGAAPHLRDGDVLTIMPPISGG